MGLKSNYAPNSSPNTENSLPEGMVETIRQFKEFLETYPSRTGRMRSKGTIRVYLSDLRGLAEWLLERGVEDFKAVNAEMLENFILNYRSRQTVFAENGTRKRRNHKITWQTRNRIITVVTLFYKWLYESEEDPPCVKKIKKLKVNPPLEERSRVKSPDDLLAPDEILRMLKACDACKTQLEAKRNRALIAVLYESGCRVGELVSIKNRDLQPTEYGFKVWVKGKTGRRQIPLVDSAKYLLEWANVHPRGDDPDAPLFCGLASNNFAQELSTVTVLTTIKKIACAAGIKKRVYTHLFRHTRATELTSYTSEAYLRAIQGWSKASPMPAFYVHLSGKDVEREILRIHGLVPKEQLRPILESKTCPFCGNKNDPHLLYCGRCGRPLKSGAQVVAELSEAQKAVEEVKELKREFRKFKDFMFKLLSSGRHPLEVKDLADFYEEAQKARGRVVDLEVKQR